jgi:hypothetical protein
MRCAQFRAPTAPDYCNRSAHGSQFTSGRSRRWVNADCLRSIRDVVPLVQLAAVSRVSWDSTTANTPTASSTSTKPTLATLHRRAARTSERVLAAVLPALPAPVSDAVLVVIVVLTVGDLTTCVGSCSSSAGALVHFVWERIIYLIVSTTIIDERKRLRGVGRRTPR